MLYYERATSDKRNPSTSLRLLLVLRWVAVSVVFTNTTGFDSSAIFDDLATAIGAIGIIFLFINYSIFNYSISTGPINIWIGACA
jgi:hypothetical protein